MSEEFVRAVKQKEFPVNAEGYYRSLSTSASHIIQPVYRQTAGVTNLMSADDIVPLVKKTIVVGFDPGSQSHTIGDEARRIGLKRKTTVFNFKPAVGLDRGQRILLEQEVLVLGTANERIETFTAKEGAQRFLQSLFTGIEIPARLIVGEPAIRDETWKENFRRHMHDVFTGIGLAEPVFFPEPFCSLPILSAHSQDAACHK